MTDIRSLTSTEIEVILDRVFSTQKRMKVKADLKKMVIDDTNPSATVQAGCNTAIDLETLTDLAELRERRETGLLEEAEDELEKGKDGKSKKGKRESKVEEERAEDKDTD